MTFIFINVIFVLAAVAMIVLILLQRGAGAAAGSGFGGGASATVFGARGSANFLSKATKWLAVVFFSISLGLAIYASKPHAAASAADDLGVMGRASTSAQTHPANAVAAPVVPKPAAPMPAIPSPAIPSPTIPSPIQNAPANSIPVNNDSAIPSPQPAVPTPNGDNGAKQGNKGG